MFYPRFFRLCHLRELYKNRVAGRNKPVDCIVCEKRLFALCSETEEGGVQGGGGLRGGGAPEEDILDDGVEGGERGEVGVVMGEV